MKVKTWKLLGFAAIVTFATQQTHAQVAEGIMIGTKLIGSAKQRGAMKQFAKSQVPQKVWIDGDTLTYVRTAEKAMRDVGNYDHKYGGLMQDTRIAEYGLETMRKAAMDGRRVVIDDYTIQYVERLRQWKDVPNEYYSGEVAFYKRYNEKWKAKKELAERLEEEAYEAKKKRAADSVLALGRLRATKPGKRGTITIDGPGGEISDEEFAMQESNMEGSTNGHRVQLIGTKAAWINQVCLHMMECKWAPESVKTEGNVNTFIYSGTCNGCDDVPRFIVKQTVDNISGITTSVDITGAANTVVAWYLMYYDKPDLTAEEALGKNFAHNFRGDQIRLTWKKDVPFIKITKNPDYQP